MGGELVMAVEPGREFEDPRVRKAAYNRDYRQGIRRPVVRVPIEARLFAKVDRLYGGIPEHAPELGQCWPWMGGKNHDGYGVLRSDEEPRLETDGRRRAPLVLAHRVALSIALGRPIREGMFGNHKCHNPPCCRPRHLYEGTAEENVRDMIEAGRYKGIAPIYRERVG